MIDFDKNTLWVEKYRPATIDECVLPDRMKKIFKGYISNNEIPNLMLMGSQGCGKTTLGKALANELHAEMLFIDASTDNGKQMIIDTLVPFASSISMVNSEQKKIILLDECDYLSSGSMASLRPIIEKYSSTTRFIFTGNFAERIIPALKSRCACFDFTITKADKPKLLAQFFNRCINILKENNVDFEKEALAQYITKMFPDYRRIINELQSYSSGYGKIDEGILVAGSNDEIANVLFPLIKENKFTEVRKWLSENVWVPDDIFSSLYAKMGEFVPQQKQPEFVITLANYQMYCGQVANPTIHILALCTQLMMDGTLV